MPEHSSHPVTLTHPRPLLPGNLAALTAAVLAFLTIATFAAAGAGSRVVRAPAVPATVSQGAGTAGRAAPAETAASESSSAVQAAQTTQPEAATAGPDRASPAALSAAVQTQAVAPSEQALAPEAGAASAAMLPGDRWLAEGFVFVSDGQEWDSTSLGNVDSALALLPASIRSQLGNRVLGQVNILVNRSGRALSGKQPYGGPANFFSTNDGRNELVLFPDQSILTILHELGHAFNLRDIAPGRYAAVLLEPEMQSFMAVSGWRVVSTPEEVMSARDHLQVQMAYNGAAIWPKLSNNDPLEDFANSFALYFFSPQQLKQKSPERFAWFEASIGR